MERKPINSRRINVETFKIGADKILVVGQLDDEHCFPLLVPTKGMVPAGKVHVMRLELEVTYPDMAIVAARGEMAKVPMNDCHHVIAGLQGLVGLKIRAGFGREVTRLLGSDRGCLHLRCLLKVMADATFQAGAVFVLERGSFDNVSSNSRHLENSCYTWRSNGPYMHWLREQAEERRR